jgi:hypothetical protein
MSKRQEKSRVHFHAEAVRAEALKLVAEGYTARAIALRINVPMKTVQGWARKAHMSFKDPAAERPARKGMSGVIAPPVYPGGRGYRWGSGW